MPVAQGNSNFHPHHVGYHPFVNYHNLNTTVMRRVFTQCLKLPALCKQQFLFTGNKLSIFPKSAFLLFYFLIMGIAVFAQTTTTFPPASSCTSKDLELVSATLTGGDVCNTCAPGATLTRTLTLAINNKTGSTRTAFAFWGTLVVTHADNTVTTTPISRCSGPIPSTGPLPASYSGGDFGTVTYTCGDALKITNLFLAWTDASPKSTCATINSATINPKCGTLPEIQINAGVNGSVVAPALTCYGASNGTINLTPFGGTGPYTFAWSASNGGSIPSGQASNEDLTGLTKGTYSCLITDSKSCTFTKVVTLTGPSAALALAASSKTDVTCFGGSNGTVTAGGVTNSVGTVSYSWKNASNVVVASTANKTGLPAGIYTLTVTDDCSSQSNSVTIGGPSVAMSLGTCSKTDVTCAGGDGSVTAGTVSNSIGTVNYSWKNSSNVEIATTATKTGLNAGTYTLTVTDDCSSQTCSVTVGAPPTITTPSASVTKQPDCSTATGTVTVASPDGATTYTLTQAGVVKYTAVSGVFSNVVAGTYTLVASIGICSQTGNNVTVNPQPATPGTPSVCVVQPSLCGPSTGKVNFTNLGTGYQYSIDNGAHWQDCNVFPSVAAGGVSGLKVKSPAGCISPSANCNTICSSDPVACTVTGRIAAKSTNTITDAAPLQVKAYPNPFNEKINFVVTSPVSGKGSLDVYNSLGQKIKTVYQGNINKGIQNFELRLSQRQVSNLVYVLRVDGQQVSGKILQVNQ
jgi:hypothetical protein